MESEFGENLKWHHSDFLRNQVVLSSYAYRRTLAGFKLSKACLGPSILILLGSVRSQLVQLNGFGSPRGVAANCLSSEEVSRGPVEAIGDGKELYSFIMVQRSSSLPCQAHSVFTKGCVGANVIQVQ